MKEKNKILTRWEIIIGGVIGIFIGFTITIITFIPTFMEISGFYYTPIVKIFGCMGEDCFLYMLLENLLIGIILGLLFIFTFVKKLKIKKK